MAQGNVIERFFIALGLDTKDVEKGIDKTVSTVKSGLKEMLVGAVLPAVGALASGALVQQFTEEITQVDRLSKSLGVNIEQMQAWQGVAENAGVAADEIGELFADLNDWMVDADQNQSGAMYEYIEKGLLPAVRDANGAMKSTEQYALEMADAFAKMGEQQATGIGRQIGIGNAGLVAMLQQGGANISAQLQQIKALGVYTEDDAKAAREFDKASKDLFRSLKMMLLPVFRLIVPLATAISKGIQELSKHLLALVPLATALGTAFTLHMIVPGGNVHRQVKWLSAAFARFGRAPFKTIAAGIKAIGLAIKGFLLSPVTAIIIALAALGIALDDFFGWIEGKESLFGDFWIEIFGSKEAAINTVNEVKQSIAELWQFIKDNKDVIKKIATVVLALTAIISVVNGIITVIGALSAAFSAVAAIMAPAFGPVGIAIMAVIALIYELITHWDEWKNVFNDVVNSITEKWNSFVDTIKSGIDWIAEKVDWIGSMFDSLPSLSGIPGLATPLTAGVGSGNMQNNVNNGQYQITQNMTFNGVKDGEQAAGLVKENAWSGLTAQGNASQTEV